MVSVGGGSVSQEWLTYVGQAFLPDRGEESAKNG